MNVLCWSEQLLLNWSTKVGSLYKILRLASLVNIGTDLGSTLTTNMMWQLCCIKRDVAQWTNCTTKTVCMMDTISNKQATWSSVSESCASLHLNEIWCDQFVCYKSTHTQQGSQHLHYSTIAVDEHMQNTHTKLMVYGRVRIFNWLVIAPWPCQLHPSGGQAVLCWLQTPWTGPHDQSWLLLECLQHSKSMPCQAYHSKT